MVGLRHLDCGMANAEFGVKRKNNQTEDWLKNNSEIRILKSEIELVGLRHFDCGMPNSECGMRRKCTSVRCATRNENKLTLNF